MSESSGACVWGKTHSTLAWRAATGLSGVEMDERRSLRVEEESLRAAEERVRRASIIPSWLRECVR